MIILFMIIISILLYQLIITLFDLISIIIQTMELIMELIYESTLYLMEDFLWLSGNFWSIILPTIGDCFFTWLWCCCSQKRWFVSFLIFHFGRFYFSIWLWRLIGKQLNSSAKMIPIGKMWSGITPLWKIIGSIPLGILSSL